MVASRPTLVQSLTRACLNVFARSVRGLRLFLSVGGEVWWACAGAAVGGLTPYVRPKPDQGMPLTCSPGKSADCGCFSALMVLGALWGSGAVA